MANAGAYDGGVGGGTGDPAEGDRRADGVGCGTRLSVKQSAEGVLLTPVGAVFAATRGEDVFGYLGPVERARSVEEMEAGIGEEVRRRWAWGRY